MVLHVEGIEVRTETSLSFLLELFQLHDLVVVLLTIFDSLVPLLKMRAPGLEELLNLLLLIGGILIHLLQPKVRTPRFIALIDQLMTLQITIIHILIDAGMLPRAHDGHCRSIASLFQLLHHLLNLGVCP